MPELRAGKQIENENWNGSKLKGKIMYLQIQKPDENSKNTEPYIMMYVGTHKVKETTDSGQAGWEFKRFPWLASTLDLFSEGWQVRDKAE